MLTNSELPNCLLKHNNELNDYDFVLFHLYISDHKYRTYYKNQRIKHPERVMIFDNSAYEFYVKNETLNLDAFCNAICELKPDMYILPDVLMSKEKTLNGVTNFLLMFGETISNVSPKSQPLAVAQGMSADDLMECIEQYKSMNIKNIAIPFHNRFFKEIGERVHPVIQQAFVNEYGQVLTEDHVYAMGRVKFMFEHKDILRDFKWVHLLGSHCPLEKIFYREFNSMDTGYPVKCGIAGVELGKETSKPNIIIDEFLNKNLSKNTCVLIKQNVLKFKHM